MKKKHKGKILDKKDGFSVIDCSSCGFKHISPIINEKNLRKFYEKEFYQIEKPNYLKETKEDIVWWMTTYNNYYSFFEKHTNGRDILDIGSGPGHFLLCGKRRGWNAIGVEPSNEAYEYSKRRGLTVFKNFFSYKELVAYGKFDVIHASMVLEHIPNPIKFLREAKKLLKPNGLLAIFCPNDYNPLQLVLKEQLKFKSWWVSPRHHINYFNFLSIERLLRRMGFDVKESLATFPLEFFLLSGINYIGNPILGRKCHSIRKKFEMNMYKKNIMLLNNIYKNFSENGIGREFMIIARKKS